MTKEKAIEVLKRCAEVCPTSPLAEACWVGINAIVDYEIAYDRGQEDAYRHCEDELRKVLEPHECETCRNADRAPSVYPCGECQSKDKWEPKEDGHD